MIHEGTEEKQTRCNSNNRASFQEEEKAELMQPDLTKCDTI